MFNVFIDDQSFITYSVKKYSEFDFIKRRYTDELIKIKDYYRNKDKAVNNSHILSRLIKMLMPASTLDKFSYLRIVDDSAKHISKQFNIVSTINSGKVMDGVIGGNHSKDILLYTELGIELDELETGWKDYAPLKVIYTKNTDIDFKIPDIKDDLIFPEITIYELDVVGMMLQYREWANERLSRAQSTDVNVYISQYVLTNTLDSSLDLTLFNRFVAIAEGTELYEFDIDHPFLVMDLSSRIDKLYSKIYKDLNNTNIEVAKLLKNIPMIVNDNALDALGIQVSLYTKQSNWVLWLSRIPTLASIVRILGKRGLKTNKKIFNRFPVMEKTMRSSRTMDNKLDPIDIMDYTYDIDYLKSTLGKR